MVGGNRVNLGGREPIEHQGKRASGGCFIDLAVGMGIGSSFISIFGNVLEITFWEVTSWGLKKSGARRW